VGFEEGLKDWGSLIKKGGFLVVHDQYQDHLLKLQLISECGYKLMDSFLISHEVWWSDYYRPLEKHVYELQKKRGGDHELQNALKKEEEEIEMFKKDPQSYSSIFYLMQKI
jgi:hypothetical protein